MDFDEKFICKTLPQSTSSAQEHRIFSLCVCRFEEKWAKSSAHVNRPFSLFCLLIVTCWLALAGNDRAEEVQKHGLVFEQWVRDTFFDGYKPASYTQKWDIPADHNTAHGGIPANPKATKFGGPLDMGDALRQFGIAEKGERFLLVAGFWVQEGDTKKWVNAVAADVSPEQYRALWEPITREDLEKLDSVVKDKSLSLEEARAEAQKIKRRVPFSKAIMEVNPKIDAHQRRLQCSIRFGDFFHFLAPAADPTKQEQPKLWNVPLPGPFVSKSRSFK